MLEELRKINSALENMQGDKKTLEFRKEILRTRTISNKQLSETSTTEFESEEIEEYCKELIMNTLESKELPHMPEAVDNKRNSRGATSIIKNLLSKFKFDTSSTLLSATYKEISKAKTVAELKSALKVYALALEQHQELKELNEHVQWLADLTDNQEKEISTLLEAKRQNEELFGAYKEVDKDLEMFNKSEQMKATLESTDTEICSVLGINRNKLNRLRAKYREKQ